MRQPTKCSEDVFPIVPVRLFSGDSSQQDQIEGAGVIDIRCDVQKILAEPPETRRSTEVLPIAEQQGDRADKRYEQLAESTPEEHDEPSKGGENYVACLMERKIYQVHEGHDTVGHLQGGEKILQEIEEQEDIDAYSPGKIKDVDIFIDTKKKITQRTPEVSATLLRF